MDNADRIIQAFKSKFDNMSPEERFAYLDNMGLKYEKKATPVPEGYELIIPSTVSKALCIPVEVVTKTIVHRLPRTAVFTSPAGMRTFVRTTKPQKQEKKIRGVAQLTK